MNVHSELNWGLLITNECHLLDRWMEVVPEEIDSDYEYDPYEDAHQE